MSRPPGHHRVRFEPSHREVWVPAGVTLAAAGTRVGLDLLSACGGLAICAGCQIRVEGDSSAEPSRARLTADQLASGGRLACVTPVVSDLVVTVPDALSAHGARTASPAEAIEPLVTVHPVVLGPGHESHDTDLLRTACGPSLSGADAVEISDHWSASLAALRDAGATRARAFVLHGADRQAVVWVESGESARPSRSFGLVAMATRGACVVQLVDLARGRVVVEERQPNRVEPDERPLAAGTAPDPRRDDPRSRMRWMANSMVLSHGFSPTDVDVAIILAATLEPAFEAESHSAHLPGVGSWRIARELSFSIHPAAPVVMPELGEVGIPVSVALGSMPDVPTTPRIHVQFEPDGVWLVRMSGRERMASRISEYPEIADGAGRTAKAPAARDRLAALVADYGDSLDDPSLEITAGGMEARASSEERTWLADSVPGGLAERLHWTGRTSLDVLRDLLLFRRARVAWSEHAAVLRRGE